MFFIESQIISSSEVSFETVHHKRTFPPNHGSLFEDRLKLLVHILCELKDSHGVTAEKLREAGQDVHRQITPSHRLQVLEEIYFVRGMEEKYLDGDLGGQVNALDACHRRFPLTDSRRKCSPPGYSHSSPRSHLS